MLATHKTLQFGTTWYSGNGRPKDKMKSQAALTQSKCQVQLTDPDTGYRRFGCYETWEDAIRCTTVLGGNRRHLFEIIPDGKPCKPYLDIDGSHFPPECPDLDSLIARLQALITRIFELDYEVGLEPSDFVWLHSPQATKISIHLIIATHAPQYVYKSNHQDDPQGAAHLAHRINILDPIIREAGLVDLAVYTKDREMRMMGASKFEKKHSVLVRWKPKPSENTTEMDLQDLVTTSTELQALEASVCSSAATVRTVRTPPRNEDEEEETSPEALLCEFRSSVISWLDDSTATLHVPLHIPRFVSKKRQLMQKPSDATMTDEVQEACHTVVRMTELLRESLHPTAYHDPSHGPEDPLNPARGVKFNYENRTDPCYTGNVHEGTQNLRCFVDEAGDVFAKCFSEQCCSEPSFRLGRLHADNNSFLSAAVTVNLPFIFPLNVENRETPPEPGTDQHAFDSIVDRWFSRKFRVLSLKSAMGTGKSTWLHSVIDRLLPSVSILVVTFRQTLAIEQERTLGRHGFANYLNVTQDLHDRKKYPRIICQVDSLWKLGSHVRFAPTFDLVILDEVESILRHHASPTIKTPIASMDLFVALLKNSTMGVITMDAFWGLATHQFLENVALSNQLIVNTFRPTPRTFSFTNDGPAWQKCIIDDLAAGQNVVLVSLSAEMIYKVRDAVLEAEVLEAKDILVHTSKSDDTLKRQLLDVDALWKRHKFVAYSPTISAGVDFSSRHFDRMYLYVCPMTCVPLGTLQMTGRVRHLKEPTVLCCAPVNLRISGAAKRRAVTVVEMHRYLTWMDSSLREREVTAVGTRVTCDYGNSHDDDDNENPCLGSWVLPVPTTLLSIQAHYECERHNGQFRFFYDFQDLAADAGHTTVTTCAIRTHLPEEIIKIKAGTGSVGHAQKCLIQARDVTEEEMQALHDRVYGMEADEDDKWADYKAQYKLGWGIDKIDKAFVDAHGTNARCPKTALLIRTLFPALHINPDVSTIDREGIMKAPLVAEVLEAMGFKSPFDTEHEVSHIMGVWETRLKHTHTFQNYKEHVRLFNQRGITGEFDHNKLSKAVNMILGAVGLKLEATVSRSQKAGLRDRKYTYKLDGDSVSEMIELVKLKLRGSMHRDGATNSHAREILRECQLPRYKHLIDVRQKCTCELIVDTV